MKRYVKCMGGGGSAPAPAPPTPTRVESTRREVVEEEKSKAAGKSIVRSSGDLTIDRSATGVSSAGGGLKI